ncbi:MAG: sigma factor [Bryobacteraceae bacterium]
MASQKTESSSLGLIGPLSPEVRQKLILEHLPRVKLIARQIHGRHRVSVALDDLIAAGVVGLIAAIDRYDSRRDVDLKTYAQFEIRSAILSSVRRSYLSKKRCDMTLTETQSSGPTLPESRTDAEFNEVREKGLVAAATAKPEESAASYGLAGTVAGQYVRSLIEDPIVQILMAAAAAFQRLETGRSWLLTPSPSLGNVAPVSLISSRAGREIVANELGLIEHGMF